MASAGENRAPGRVCLQDGRCGMFVADGFDATPENETRGWIM